MSYQILTRRNFSTARATSGASSLRAKPGDGPLTLEQIRTVTPSVFAEQAHGSRSGRYTYIPTSEILEGLAKEGFRPYAVAQGGSRIEEKRGFTKHLIRLRHDSSRELTTADKFAEIILLNSHDGTSSYQMAGGMFRLSCLNGLIASAELIDEMKVPHKGDVQSNVIDGCIQILGSLPIVADSAREMESLILTDAEQAIFAKAALALRYEEQPPFEAGKLLARHRSSDAPGNVWTTFNTVQENMIRGGVRYTQLKDGGNGKTIRRQQTSRPIEGIDQSTALNKALWTLAEEMKALKSGQS